MRLGGSLLGPSLLVAACGGNVVVDGALPSTGVASTGGSTSGVTAVTSTSGVTAVTGGGGAGGVSAGGGGGAGGAPTECLPDGGPTTFPAAFKVCNTTSDCSAQPIHDCCTTYLVGVGQKEVAAFKAYEAACEDLPKCDCEGPTLAETGGTSGNIVTLCTAGLCTTYGL